MLELPILKSEDLNLKACAFKFLIVPLLCYSILFYFNLYSSLAVTNGLCMFVCIYICIYIYVYMYVYIYIYICM